MNKLQITKKQITKGVTIVELLVYMGLLFSFLIIMTDIFVAGFNFRLSSESASTIRQDSQFILSKLFSDFSESQVISEPSALGGTSPTLILDNITYTLSGNNLARNGVIINGPDTQIQNLSFIRTGNIGGVPAIQISFDIVSRITKQGGNIERETIQTTLGLR